LAPQSNVGKSFESVGLRSLVVLNNYLDNGDSTLLYFRLKVDWKVTGRDRLDSGKLTDKTPLRQTPVRLNHGSK